MKIWDSVYIWQTKKNNFNGLKERYQPVKQLKDEVFKSLFYFYAINFNYWNSLLQAVRTIGVNIKQ